jgi:hypothetical protein
MFQLFKSHLKDPATLRDIELEPTFIDLKNQIIIVSPYTNETKYNHLYSRLGGVMSRIVDRHRHYFVEADNKIDTSGLIDLFIQTGGDNWSSRKSNHFRLDLNFSRFESDILLYLCFYAYVGGVIKLMGIIDKNPKFMTKILNFLVKERGYMPAVFFQGLTFKYGISLHVSPKLDLAKGLLETAAAAGVGSAIIELEQFDLHIHRNRYNGALELP